MIVWVLRGGVYMRKLRPAWVLFRDDFFISYSIYIITWWWVISYLVYLKVHFILIKYISDSNPQTLRMRYQFQFTGRPISHRNGWSFRVYMILLRNSVPEWNSRSGTTTGLNSRRGDSRWHEILWWCHVNKYRPMRGNRSEFAPARKWPRCHVILQGSIVEAIFVFLQIPWSCSRNFLNYFVSELLYADGNKWMKWKPTETLVRSFAAKAREFVPWCCHTY